MPIVKYCHQYKSISINHKLSVKPITHSSECVFLILGKFSVAVFFSSGGVALAFLAFFLQL